MDSLFCWCPDLYTDVWRKRFTGQLYLAVWRIWQNHMQRGFIQTAYTERRRRPYVIRFLTCPFFVVENQPSRCHFPRRLTLRNFLTANPFVKHVIFLHLYSSLSHTLQPRQPSSRRLSPCLAFPPPVCATALSVPFLQSAVCWAARTRAC